MSESLSDSLSNGELLLILAAGNNIYDIQCQVLKIGKTIVVPFFPPLRFLLGTLDVSV